MRKPGIPSGDEIGLFMALLTAQGGMADTPKYKIKSANTKPTFTVEELATLETLEGKAKKKYLKELKDKYE